MSELNLTDLNYLSILLLYMTMKAKHLVLFISYSMMDPGKTLRGQNRIKIKYNRSIKNKVF